MASHDLEFIETFSPSSTEIDFLTEKINEESRAQNISCDAFPFGILVRKKIVRDKKEEKEQIDCCSSIVDSLSSSTSSTRPPTPPTTLKKVEGTGKNITAGERCEHMHEIVGGCNGSVVYGSIYTDQLWVDKKLRGKGIGKLLMEKVHEIAKRKQCSFATVGTMDFQGAQLFYEKLGYKVEFEREGYAKGGKMIYLKKVL